MCVGPKVEALLILPTYRMRIVYAVSKIHNNRKLTRKKRVFKTTSLNLHLKIIDDYIFLSISLIYVVILITI